MDEPGHLASVYVEYSLRANLSTDRHIDRKCCLPPPGSSEPLPSPEECAKKFLDSLPECEKQLCLLAEQFNYDKDVDTLLRSRIQNLSTEQELSNMLYKIWYKVLLDGTSAGCILSCISFCGMVATMAYEMGIPVDNITNSFNDLMVTRRSNDFWSYFKSMALKCALYIGSQFLISTL